jgi:peptidoglycan/xylan/chitin deacetylase (PgdA/CDA1 family)
MSDKKLLISINVDHISKANLEETLILFSHLNLRGTFFISINWAKQYPALARQLAASHEIGLYAYAGGDMDSVLLKEQKVTLEHLSTSLVYGFRSAGSHPVDATVVKTAGFIYQALEGRNRPRSLFLEKDLWSIPLSSSLLLKYTLTAEYLANTILKKDGMMAISYPLKTANSFLQFLQKKGQFCANIDWLQDQLNDDN